MKKLNIITWIILVSISLATLSILYVPAESGKAIGVLPDSTENAISAYNFIETGKFGIKLNGIDYPTRYLPWFQLSFLVPTMKFMGNNVYNAIYATEIAGFILIVLLAILAKRMHSIQASCVVIPGILLFPQIYYLSNHAMNEVPYLMLLVASFYFYTEWKNKEQKKDIFLILYALFIAWAGGLRTSGWGMIILPLIDIVCLKRSLKEKISKFCLTIFPSAVIIVASIAYNCYIFQSPFRNGYNYWCPVPHDFNLLVFNVSYIPQNILLMIHECSVFMFVLAIVLWIIFRKRFVANQNSINKTQFALQRDFFYFSLTHYIILLIIYLPYYGVQSRYMRPGGLLMLFSAFILLISIGINMIKGNIEKGKVFFSFCLLFFAVVIQWILLYTPKNQGDVGVEYVEAESYKFCSAMLPMDATLIVTYNPAIADLFFVKDYRKLLPAFREIAYVNYIVSMQSVAPFLEYENLKNNPKETMSAAPALSSVAELPFPRVIQDESPYMLQEIKEDFFLPEPAFHNGRIYVTNFALLQMGKKRAQRIREHAKLVSVARNESFEIFLLVPPELNEIPIPDYEYGEDTNIKKI